MSLSAGEQQALGAIEDALTESCPGLAAMLTTFTRLAADTGMPGHEKVGPCEPQVTGHHHRVRRRHDLTRGLLLWLALAVTLIAASGIGLAASHDAIRACTESFALACTERTNAKPPRPAGQRPVRGESVTSRAATHG
jgi:hypothetical protein